MPASPKPGSPNRRALWKAGRREKPCANADDGCKGTVLIAGAYCGACQINGGDAA